MIRNRYEEIAEKFPHGNLLSGYHHFRRLELALQFLNELGHNLLVLDAGCGDAFQAERISWRNEVVCIDISRTRINRAKKRVPKAAFIICDIYRPPFKDNVFNVVTLLEVIEHLRKPRNALRELRRVTARKGHLILDTRSKSNIVDMFLRSFGKEPNWGLRIDETHVSFYDEDSAKKLLSTSGFRVLEVKGASCIRHGLLYIPFLGSLSWNRWGWWFFKITDKFFDKIPGLKTKGSVQVFLCRNPA